MGKTKKIKKEDRILAQITGEQLLEEQIPEEKQRYIPISKLIKLRKQGLSYRQIGKLLGISYSTVADRLKYFDTDKKYSSFPQIRASLFQQVQEKYIETLMRKPVENSTVRDIASAIAILYDKERLETNKSTENVMTIHRIIEDLEKERRKKIENEGSGDPEKPEKPAKYE